MAAALWDVLRREVLDTVDDFRQKGALGALRDAALDAKDIVTSAGAAVAGGVQSLVVGDAEPEPGSEAGGAGASSLPPVLRSTAVPVRSATLPLEFPDGRRVDAVVVGVDGISEPPRASVTYEGCEEPLLVLVLPPDASGAEAPAELGFFDGLRQDWKATVQEIQEKGAVGAVRDVALDAADLFGSAAKSAVSGARHFAGDLIDLTTEPSAAPAPEAREGAASASSSAASPAPGAAAAEGPENAQEQARAEDATERRGNLLDDLRGEWTATVQDFREKGAVGAFRDAALDAVDMVGSTAASVAGGAMRLVDGRGGQPAEQVGESSNGDGGAPAGGPRPSLLDDFRSDLTATVHDIRDRGAARVEDIRQRGAASVMKDAALDAVDIVGSTANAVASRASKLAGPLLEDFWMDAGIASSSPPATSPPGANAAAGASGAAEATFAPPARSAAGGGAGAGADAKVAEGAQAQAEGAKGEQSATSGTEAIAAASAAAAAEDEDRSSAENVAASGGSADKAGPNEEEELLD